MSTTTVNISLPKEMYKDVKRAVKVKRYTSVSEMVRDALRNSLYEEITENGFAPAFEDEVLAAETEPEENDIILKTDEDTRNYFLHLKVPQKSPKPHDQDKERR